LTGNTEEVSLSTAMTVRCTDSCPGVAFGNLRPRPRLSRRLTCDSSVP
jgi:hypothetical protein